MRYGVADYREDRRARNDEQYRGRGDKGKPEFNRHEIYSLACRSMCTRQIYIMCCAVTAHRLSRSCGGLAQERAHPSDFPVGLTLNNARRPGKRINPGRRCVGWLSAVTRLVARFP